MIVTVVLSRYYRTGSMGSVFPWKLPRLQQKTFSGLVMTIAVASRFLSGHDLEHRTGRRRCCSTRVSVSDEPRRVMQAPLRPSCCRLVQQRSRLVIYPAWTTWLTVHTIKFLTTPYTFFPRNFPGEAWTTWLTVHTIQLKTPRHSFHLHSEKFPRRSLNNMVGSPHYKSPHYSLHLHSEKFPYIFIPRNFLTSSVREISLHPSFGEISQAELGQHG